ncbi:type III PLP-dependent enzyme [Methylophaga sp. OBS4]|uniref:type III PLP-dependent enzyme n=1 Tax=Methylophaga sp. OBS4 TaxID=2991935 RepID=UPI0022536AB3|nr:type III PLP-dependent enzyme [Methylophaga sp. OBS4]MCX4187000.1 type III PLP-dependent enzyme [Methylophaga sp. OBS4]
MTPSVNQELSQLQQQRSTPFCGYVYDLSALRRHIADMKAALPAGCELFYAAKANPDPAILQTLKPYVDGFEAASGGELNWLLQHCPEHRLIFGGPGKLPAELTSAVDKQIETIHVESLTELQRLADIVSRHQTPVQIMLRMNIALEGLPTTRLTMGGKPTPFGLDESELPQALAMIKAVPLLQLQGFHFHLMSHQLNVDNHLALIGLYLRSVRKWCGQFAIDVPVINVGGGLGINYLSPSQHFDWQRFCQQLPTVICEQQAERFRLRFECGRYVTATCGFYVMEVLDIKNNLGEWFAIGHGGTHHFRTPAAQSHDHPFSILPRQRGNAVSIENQKVTLVGQLCTPKDVLARRQHVDSIAIGDWIVFSLAGAYAWNISHQNFLMHEAPEMIYLTGT